MILRQLLSKIKADMFKNKAILLYGARQTGKTTLIKELLKEYVDDVLFLNGDESDIQALLTDVTTTKWKSLLGSKRVLFIDEAQRIESIGVAIKIIIDQIPEVQVIATGSSSFELANKTSEPLTGRKFVYHLFPLSFGELQNHSGVIEEKRNIEKRLIFGSYPDVVRSQGDEKRILQLLADSYLYKDLLMFEEIKKPQLLVKILKALALQIGSEVSYSEIAQLVGSNKNTVEKYIDLLEKVFVLFTVYALSRNVRNELKKSKKVYFYDNGIRNAVLGNYAPIVNRTDAGALWENYLISERLKFLHAESQNCDVFFWRTTQQQEIDYVESRQGVLNAFELKWNSLKKGYLPLTFSRAYPDHTFRTISPKNYDLFLSEL